MKNLFIKKTIAAALTSATILGVLPMAASAEAKTGWVLEAGKTGKWHYYDQNGVMLKNTTVQGYALDADGALIQKNTTSNSNKTTKENPKGKWFLDNNNWYYRYNGENSYAKGWVYDRGQWYYCDEQGVMLRNTSKIINGKKFTFGDDGAYINC